MFIAASASAWAAWNTAQLTKRFNQRQLACEFSEFTHEFLDAYADWDRALRDFVLATYRNKDIETTYFSEQKHWRRMLVASASKLDLYLETALKVDIDMLEQFRGMISDVEAARRSVKELLKDPDEQAKEKIKSDSEYIIGMLDRFNTFIRKNLVPHLKQQ